MEFQRRIINLMLDRKSPADTASLVGDLMPRMMASMPPDQFEQMMQDNMPGMMDTYFSVMNAERRESMLGHCRAILDNVEDRYVTPAAPWRHRRLAREHGRRIGSHAPFTEM